MRLLFVADGRSPIALNWIEYFLERGCEVHLASTYPCQPDGRLASYTLMPVAFSRVKGGRKTSAGALGGGAQAGLRTRIRQWFGPLTLPAASRRLQALISRLQPDLVHAMRIPYEGMAAALARPQAPLLISVWGNDFTLHAPSTPMMRWYTRLALGEAAALHTDCRRDLRLARAWGFAVDRPAVVLPGAGGVQPDLFFPPQSEITHTVINPRGFRAYIRNQAFFRSIPLVLERHPGARFLCPAMAGEPQARRWVEELGIANSVDLLPPQTRPQMAELFRLSRAVVSPSVHDGTPNTLLEAMACGCVPVAGDLESLREWIEPGVNGLLVDPEDPQELAQATLTALDDAQLYRRAREHNLRLVAERAAYPQVMEKALDFYSGLVGNGGLQDG
jgi:hypothetical protein